MALERKKGWIVLTSLLFGTFGAHAVYSAHAKGGGHPLAVVAAAPETSRTLTQARAALGLRTEPTPRAPVKVETGDGSVGVTAMVDRTKVLQSSDGLLHVEVSVKANTLPGGPERAPADVVVVLDHSGSMSGTKLDYAKQALLGLIDRLGPGDRLGVVTFSSDARVLIPLSSDGRSGWRRQVQALETGGGTNIGSGLDLGLEMLAGDRRERAARVLLLSDGHDNDGAAAFPRLVARARDLGEKGAVLSAFGIGHDFDEHVMTSLATVGTGAFYYLAKLEVLAPMLDAELKTASETYAEKATLHVRLGEGMTLLSAGALPIETRGGESVVALGSLYAGRERKLWLTVRAPTTSTAERDLGKLAVRYDRGAKTFEVVGAALPTIACVSDEKTFEAAIVPDVWKRAVLEEELTRAREELGDAIARGTAKDVDTSVKRVERHLSVAQKLGQKEVVEAISKLESQGTQAKAAQLAAPSVRNQAAKREKALGYGQRNSSMYSDPSWNSGF